MAPLSIFLGWTMHRSGNQWRCSERHSTQRPELDRGQVLDSLKEVFTKACQSGTQVGARHFRTEARKWPWH